MGGGGGGGCTENCIVDFIFKEYEQNKIGVGVGGGLYQLQGYQSFTQANFIIEEIYTPETISQWFIYMDHNVNQFSIFGVHGCHLWPVTE